MPLVQKYRDNEEEIRESLTPKLGWLKKQRATNVHFKHSISKIASKSIDLLILSDNIKVTFHCMLQHPISLIMVMASIDTSLDVPVNLRIS